MQHISASSLSDLPTRISYLRSFIEFSAADAATLHASRDVVAPLVPVVVDTVYTKLLSFDITARAFVPRQTGYAGEAPASLADLSHDHPQIRFRKDFLARYLVKLVSMDYDDISSWEYLDKVGLMHTGQAGFAHRSVPPPPSPLHKAGTGSADAGVQKKRAKRPALRVEYTHCAILLGYVEDILVNAVMGHPDLDNDTKTAVLRAVNKVRLLPSATETALVLMRLNVCSCSGSRTICSRGITSPMPRRRMPCSGTK